MRKIPLIRPYITQEVKTRVLAVLDSGYLTEGPVTRELEAAFEKFTGGPHALAVTSCTTGLETALRCLGLGPGDEVIVPDYTYPATADAVAIVGATPVLVDVFPRTMLVDYAALETALTDRTRAIIPVSLFGNPLDYDQLNRLKQKAGLYIVEDAACALGAEYQGRKAGALADISVFSLHPRKFITTGEGGMITTDRADWAEWMNSYKHFGLTKAGSREGAVFGRLGTNYKLSGVLAAIGLAQMERLGELLERRRALARNYVRLLSGQPGVTLPETTAGGVHSYQSFCVFVEDRDRVKRVLRDRGIEVQIGTYALHLQPVFQDRAVCRLAGDLPGSRFAFEHCLTLPLYHDLTAQDQEYVVDSLLALL
ncbi:MAG: DegT/DnrJ/EryC1/StrS aminotransferase family protein [Thermodesulfobacteriota bacterium]